MNDHLAKAKAAICHAAELNVDLDAEVPPKSYTRLLDLALIQANIAQADALERIAAVIESGNMS